MPDQPDTPEEVNPDEASFDPDQVLDDSVLNADYTVGGVDETPVDDPLNPSPLPAEEEDEEDEKELELPDLPTEEGPAPAETLEETATEGD